jgi:broad specificity phosphatase PhoE
MTRNSILFIFCLILGLKITPLYAQEIFLIRHAEKKQDASEDPTLTTKGQARARWLAHFFSDKRLEKIYSTDYKRTRLTVFPTAALYNLEIELYDPRNPNELVEVVLNHKKNTLIVAHSNTLPQLVHSFGGAATDDIAHDEYDRLYWLSIEKKQVKTQLLKSETLAKSNK